MICLTDCSKEHEFMPREFQEIMKPKEDPG